jgi:hypothetical protein
MRGSRSPLNQINPGARSLSLECSTLVLAVLGIAVGPAFTALDPPTVPPRGTEGPDIRRKMPPNGLEGPDIRHSAQLCPLGVEGPEVR